MGRVLCWEGFWGSMQALQYLVMCHKGTMRGMAASEPAPGPQMPKFYKRQPKNTTGVLLVISWFICENGLCQQAALCTKLWLQQELEVVLTHKGENTVMRITREPSIQVPPMFAYALGLWDLFQNLLLEGNIPIFLPNVWNLFIQWGIPRDLLCIQSLASHRGMEEAIGPAVCTVSLGPGLW